MNEKIVLTAQGYDRVDGRNAYQSTVKKLTLGAPVNEENKKECFYGHTDAAGREIHAGDAGSGPEGDGEWERAFWRPIGKCREAPLEPNREHKR